MGLLCMIGLHRPAPDQVWNAGHCFARCSGCGRDLVRRSGERWHVPRGYRVVWKKQSEVALDILLTQADRATGASRRAVDLPIQEVLRQLSAADIMREEPGSGAWDAEISIPVDRARARIDGRDFMQPKASDVVAPAAPAVPAAPEPAHRPRPSTASAWPEDQPQGSWSSSTRETRGSAGL